MHLYVSKESVMLFPTDVLVFSFMFYIVFEDKAILAFMAIVFGLVTCLLGNIILVSVSTEI